MAHSLESLPPHALSLELKSVYLFKVFGWAISIKLVLSIWGWLFSFWLVCLNDDWAVLLINKIVNTDRNSLWALYKGKDYKSKSNSLEVWILFVWLFIFFSKGWKQERRSLSTGNSNYAGISAAGIQPRSILQEPSELANQISLDNLLQMSAAFKSTSASLPSEAGCTWAWDLKLSLLWQGRDSRIF